MKQFCKVILCLSCVAFVLSGCRDKAQSKVDAAESLTVTGQAVKTVSKSEKEEDIHKYEVADRQRITDFIPKGYKLFNKISGDLNKDGYIDCVLIIKATRKDGFVKDFKDEVVDRNRRGIIVLFNKESGYEVASKNYTCFSSENEDGGVYYAPELWVEVKDSKLFVHFAHGRYGYWEYCFRYQDSDFMLIGYEASSDRGPVVLRKVSVNFLTRVKYVDENINPEGEEEDEEFEREVIKLKKRPLKKLSEIADFDELEI